MNYSQKANRLREKMGKFSGELSQGLPKTARRFISEMIYGIQVSQSVLLTEIGRCLEEPISLKKTEGRLSRQLSRQGLESKIEENLLQKASVKIKKDTLLVLDISDIRKKYAKRMENLAMVRDGSEGVIGKGYWTMNVIATEIDKRDIVPLYKRLYSQEAGDFISENDEILRAIDKVSEEIGSKGIWVMDRGGDRNSILLPLLDGEKQFLIRSQGSRHMICGKQKKSVRELADKCICPYRETMVKYKDGKEKVYNIEFGFRKVKLPERDEQLYLLVIKGFGESPLMLLTDIRLRRSRKLLFRMLRSYLTRWAIEETIRFIKQSYDEENVRVLGYKGLQNLMPLVLAVCYFISVVLESSNKLRIMAGFVLKVAKRVFGIPDFSLYAISDGLSNIFRRHPGRPRIYFSAKEEQLLLFSGNNP